MRAPIWSWICCRGSAYFSFPSVSLVALATNLSTSFGRAAIRSIRGSSFKEAIRNKRSASASGVRTASYRRLYSALSSSCCGLEFVINYHTLRREFHFVRGLIDYLLMKHVVEVSGWGGEHRAIAQLLRAKG